MHFSEDVTKNFKLVELVPRSIYEKYGKNSIWFVRYKLISGIQILRENLGKPCTINNWHVGGDFQYSGYRPRDCNIGADDSQHRGWNAYDLKFDGLESLEVQEWIRKNFKSKELFKHFTTIENGTIGWTHVDDRYNGMSQEILEVNKN